MLPIKNNSKNLQKEMFSNFNHFLAPILALLEIQVNTDPDPGCQIKTDPHGSVSGSKTLSMAYEIHH